MNTNLNQQIWSNPGLIILAIVVSLWTMTWKAIALWRSSRQEQRNWFIALFILFPVNLLGAIELIYLFFFSKKKLTYDEIKGWFIKK